MVFDLYYNVWRIKNAPISSCVLSHMSQACDVCLWFEPVTWECLDGGQPK